MKLFQWKPLLCIIGANKRNEKKVVYSKQTKKNLIDLTCPIKRTSKLRLPGHAYVSPSCPNTCFLFHFAIFFHPYLHLKAQVGCSSALEALPSVCKVLSPILKKQNKTKRYQHEWFFLRPFSLVYRCRWPSSPCVFTWSSLCMCLCSSSSKNTSHTWLGLTLKTSS
jgi:hypothetical protein